jgi:hypothetical protein
MKTAEVEVNKKFTIAVNDKEHRAFKIACTKNDTEMAAVIRAFMREYVRVKGKRR